MFEENIDEVMEYFLGTCIQYCGTYLRHVLVMLVHVEVHLGDFMVH